MAQRKVLVVTGATGAQGGALVRAIQADHGGEFVARAITRDPNQERARALAAQGIEVVRADLDDRPSLEAAFRGAHGVFCVTNFWEHLSAEREMAQADNMAAAAQAARVEHVIWSTLEDTRRWVPLQDERMPTLQGKYKVPHFDGKGAANESFVSRRLPVTLLHTSFYWDNFVRFGMGPKPLPDGRLALTLPLADARLPGIAAEDIGKCAYGVFRAGEELRGRTIGIVGEMLTAREMATAMSRVLEREVVYNAISPAEYRALGFPGADDLGNMFQFKRDFNAAFCAARDVALSRRLDPELQTFAAWLVRHRTELPLG